MAKIDKSQYTKEEWHSIRDNRREQKRLSKIVPVPVPEIKEGKEKYYVLCLKHGKKYSSNYVNRLNNMVKRHCTLPFTFVCLTEDTTGLDQDIYTIPLPKNVAGWWCKPYMFTKDLSIKGTILYMDLDVVISGNIDKLFTYQPNAWCTIRDFTRAMRPGWPKYNSSIVRFKTGQLDFLWENFKTNQKEIQRAHFGDQDYLYAETRKTPAVLYPDSWVQSWKWEVRKSREFAPGGVKGRRKFLQVENVKPRIECCVCVFHGDPNPELCDDPWVVENWK